MNKEKIEIKMPCITNEQLEELNNPILNNLTDYTNIVLEHIYKDQELIELQTVISKQQEKIKELEKKLANRIELLNYMINKDYISKDKIKNKIEQYKKTKKEIFKLEHELGRASITYDIVRNDYCEKMLEDLLEEK